MAFDSLNGLSVSPSASGVAGLAIDNNFRAIGTWAQWTSCLWVDPNGSDSGGTIGLRGHIGRPFQTLTAAKAAASSGDTIIVRPGTYDENNLLKNGVNWHFMNGAIVSYSGTGGGIFDDFTATYIASGGSHTITGTTVVSRITGHGKFTYNGTANVAGNGAVVVLKNTSSDVTIQGLLLHHTGAHSSGFGVTGEDCVVRHAGGTLTLDFEGGEISAAGLLPSGIWWSSGNLKVRANYITAPQNTFYSTPGDGFGNSSVIGSDYTSGTHCWLNFEQVTTSGNADVFQFNGDDNARYWITFRDMIASGSTPVAHYGGKVYMTGIGKILGGGPVFDLANTSGSELWLDCQKVVRDNEDVIFKIVNDAASRTFLRVMSIESTFNSALPLLRVTSGYVNVMGGVWTSGASCNVVENSGGVIDIDSATLDSTAAAAKNPISASAAGVTAKNVTFKAASGQANVAGSSASTVSLFNTPIAAYAAGTAYSLTATPAAIAFGTTSPVVVPPAAGTYLLRGSVNLKYNGATFAANRTVTLKVRRTNNTAGDVSNSTITTVTGVVTTTTGTLVVVQLPDTIYTTLNSTDSLTIFGSLDVVPTAGSLDCVGASLTATRIG